MQHKNQKLLPFGLYLFMLGCNQSCMWVCACTSVRGCAEGVPRRDWVTTRKPLDTTENTSFMWGQLTGCEDKNSSTAGVCFSLLPFFLTRANSKNYFSSSAPLSYERCLPDHILLPLKLKNDSQILAILMGLYLRRKEEDNLGGKENPATKKSFFILLF